MSLAGTRVSPSATKLTMMLRLAMGVALFLLAFVLLGSRANAQYTSIATNTFPNPNASSPYPLYMVVGSGDFDVMIAAAVVITDAPGTYSLYIEDGHWCNMNSEYSVQSLDIPKSTEWSVPYFSTSFNVVNANNRNDFRMTPVNTGLDRVCGPAKNITTSFTVTAADYDPSYGKYRVVFYALAGSPSPRYAGIVPAAAENTFRITVNGPNNPLVYFVGKETDLGSTFFNLSNRDRPAYSSVRYQMDVALPCSAASSVNTTLSFIDADYGTLQSANGYPDLTYEVYSMPRDGSSGFTRIMGPTLVTGGNGATARFNVFNNYPIEQNKIYRLIFNGLSRPNAITYEVVLGNVAEYFASDVCNNTPVASGMTATCSANGTVTVGIRGLNDPDGGNVATEAGVDRNDPGAPKQFWTGTGDHDYTFVGRPLDGITKTAYVYIRDLIDTNFGNTLTATYACPRPPAVPSCTLAVIPISAMAGSVVEPGDTVRVTITISNGQANTTYGDSLSGWAGNVDARSIGGPRWTYSGYPAIAAGASATDSREFAVNVPSNTYEIVGWLQNGTTYIYCNDSLGVRTSTPPPVCVLGNPDCCPPTFPYCTSQPVNTRPYLRSYGGDVIAGSGFDISGCSSSNGRIRAYSNYNGSGIIGSGAQMNAFALGTVTGFRSGTQTYNDYPQARVFAHSRLAAFPSLSSPETDFGGNYGAALCATNWFEQQGVVNPISGLLNLANTSYGSGSYHVAGSLNLSASGAVTGRRTIYVDGDVTITGTNLVFNTLWSSAADVPSLIVIARGNIYIHPDVKNLDGFYISNSTIYTCYNPSQPVAPMSSWTSNPCLDNRLTVNGALLATDVKFWRLGGRMNQSTVNENYTNSITTAGETIRLSPEFMFAAQSTPSLNGSDGQSDRRYDAITSLPPTF